ncbi:unnamed protein product [Commensalibacter communis]|nr:unnamed protein product [Commensalibacter communis]CAI3930893.1 unnamed protein product [Commensalibacter communis]
MDILLIELQSEDVVTRKNAVARIIDFREEDGLLKIKNF